VAPELDHGDIDEKPTPVPRANKLSDRAAAAKAPADTAPHDTPEDLASIGRVVSATGGGGGCCAIRAVVAAELMVPSLNEAVDLGRVSAKQDARRNIGTPYRKAPKGERFCRMDGGRQVVLLQSPLDSLTGDSKGWVLVCYCKFPEALAVRALGSTFFGRSPTDSAASKLICWDSFVSFLSVSFSSSNVSRRSFAAASSPKSSA
jgi:hypothetical protein